MALKATRITTGTTRNQARALLGRPRLLILDEPTNGLDPSGMAEFRELVRELPERFETTVFISSHLLGEIEQVATRCAVLKQGRLVYQGEVAALRRGVAARVARRHTLTVELCAR